VNADTIVGIMNEQIQRVLGEAVDAYNVADVERDIQRADTRYVVASDTGDGIETTLASEGVPGEPVGVAGAKPMNYEAFLHKYPDGTETVIAESDAISRSEFPVCDLGQWYVRPEYQNQGIGLRIGVEVLKNLGPLDQYPAVAGAWKKPNGKNRHIDLCRRAGGTEIGTVRGPVLGFDRPDGTHPVFEVVLFRGDIDEIRDFVGV